MAEQVTSLASEFSEYSRWRSAVAESVMQLQTWLSRNEVGDAQADLRLQSVLECLQEDRLVIAFVAEFSRGKSELINAIFFSGYQDRILPSSSGRTTMCPTELQWTPGARAEIRLLPIESRANTLSIHELKQHPGEWEVVPLQQDSVSELQTALARVGETLRVTEEEAVRLGFHLDKKGEEGLAPGSDGLIEIPRWRHAVIEFPHPLLEKGLVVLDTPGLNAIGAEPELTLSLLPSAHAVLFILAADTGVTHSDLLVWRDYVQNERQGRKGRLAVLNKIDGLWDGLRDAAQIDAEIERQVVTVAETLKIEPQQVFPVSAQKGLVARINHDAEQLRLSRLETLEQALAYGLLPTKREIICNNALAEVEGIVQQTHELLDARLNGVREQLQEIRDLRGKNHNVIEYMMRKIRTEKEEFEQGLKKYYAVRAVFSTLTNNLLTSLGLDVLRDETRRTREAMLESSFSKGLSDAMTGYFKRLRANLHRSTEEVVEITRMLDTMYKRFSVEHGLKLSRPESFSTLRYEHELDQLEKAFNRQINNPLTLVTTEKRVLTQKFFETVVLQARRTFELANRDVEKWLRAVMSPLETQVREYQIQLKRRLESVKRIHQATDTLEERVVELSQTEESILIQKAELTAQENALYAVLGMQVTESLPVEIPERKAELV